MYNLLHEPWVCVTDMQGLSQKVSLLDVFEHAHEYAGFAGDNKAQDLAMMRLCLTILHRVFSRVNAQNCPYKQTGIQTVLQVWKELYALKQFPQEPILTYLDKWESRFELYDDKHPFFQVPAEFFTYDAEKAESKRSDAIQLDGNVAKSSNTGKINVGKMRGFSPDVQLSHDEAARWLVYHQLFDVKAGKGYHLDSTSVKTKRGGVTKTVFFPCMGTKFTMMYTEGDSLWETLMLNFVMLKNGQQLYDYTEYPASLLELPTVPCWEWDDNDIRLRKESENTFCTYLENPISMLNLQNRRIALQHNDAGMCGYWSTYGDVIDMTNNETESMMLWKIEKKDQIVRKPLVLKSSRFWESFQDMVQTDAAGVTAWLQLLESQHLVERKKFLFAGLCFSMKQEACIDEIYYGEMTLPSVFLTKLGEVAREQFAIEIAHVDKLQAAVRKYAKALMSCRFNTGGGKSAPSQVTGYADDMVLQYNKGLDHLVTTFFWTLTEEDVSEHLDESCQRLNQLMLKHAFAFGNQMWDDMGIFVNHNLNGKSPEVCYMDFRSDVVKTLYKEKQK